MNPHAKETYFMGGGANFVPLQNEPPNFPHIESLSGLSIYEKQSCLLSIQGGENVLKATERKVFPALFSEHAFLKPPYPLKSHWSPGGSTV